MSTGRTTVAVNLLWCVPGRVGGSEQYLVRQLDGLRSLSTPFVPTLYCLPAFARAHPALVSGFDTVLAPSSVRDRARRVLTEHTWLARRTGSADLVHHGGGTAPVTGGRPILLTIHDLQYETFPDYFSATKLRYLRTVVPRSVARSAAIAVPTQYVRGTVIDRFGLDPERVVVVPHGVEPDLGRSARPEDELRRHFGLGDHRVLVFPAITHPHKGHRFLLEVMAARWTDRDLRLVLIGGPGAADDEIRRQVSRLGLDDRVVFAGRVGDDDRDGLIRLADALVFPSEYEGFGAPVVEAMALGTPVVCSNQPALAEVVGDAGLVLPFDHEAWADALERVDRSRSTMTAAGRRRARRFTAATSGECLAIAYGVTESVAA
jgi:glycosyltransferase involved in cell wall biosynthesis